MAQDAPDVPSIEVGTFPQEVSRSFDDSKGLPSANVHTIHVSTDGSLYAGTAAGLAKYDGENWSNVDPFTEGPVLAFAAVGDGGMEVHYNYPSASRSFLGLTQSALLVYQGALHGLDGHRIAALPLNTRSGEGNYDLAAGRGVLLGAPQGLFVLTRDQAGEKFRFAPVEELNYWLVGDSTVHDVAVGPNREYVVAAAAGLFYSENLSDWQAVFPSEQSRSWAPVNVGAAAFGPQGEWWFGSPQGAGRLLGEWELFQGEDGLPFNAFTAAAVASNGTAWFGTTIGAMRYDGDDWAYRQGRRWLPDDAVRDVSIDNDGNAWFATANGIGVIEFKPMTLAEKAEHYETAIDKYHRRTPYEYVLQVRLERPGDTSEWTQTDSDNDGLWTSMYGAGECFAYAAIGDEKAKERAKQAFEALRFLGEVTQGGEHSPPDGFVARTILPADGPDPNEGRIARDRRKKAEDDALWKVIDPRWPVSADGKWYWKCDTSSDELDGHYFFYAQYYDLVAETESEKRRVRAHVSALTDHLIAHGFNLVDHDGRPTRWARFSPEELNFDINWWVERGLNSLSMLSYLATTEHITGDAKYGDVARRLREEHAYGQNMLYPKVHRGAGTGNQSDDEMAFMCYYNLLKYEDDPELRERYLLSFSRYWELERPELNPFFNFAYAAHGVGATFTDAWGTHDISPASGWLEESVETLKDFPLNRIDWRHTNHHRLDVVPLPDWTREFDESGAASGRGYRVDERVLPISERYINHWSADPWELDTGGNGRTLSDGAVFLMPYYMGLYHGFIK